jgi:hypothetical protein
MPAIEGEIGRVNMHNSDGVSGRVTCLLAHDLLNKLAAIVGNIDILVARNEWDPECYQRLNHMRTLAALMGEMLHQRACEVELLNHTVTLQHESPNEALSGDQRKAPHRVSEEIEHEIVV